MKKEIKLVAKALSFNAIRVGACTMIVGIAAKIIEKLI